MKDWDKNRTISPFLGTQRTAASVMIKIYKPLTFEQAHKKH